MKTAFLFTFISLISCTSTKKGTPIDSIIPKMLHTDSRPSQEYRDLYRECVRSICSNEDGHNLLDLYGRMTVLSAIVIPDKTIAPLVDKFAKLLERERENFLELAKFVNDFDRNIRRDIPPGASILLATSLSMEKYFKPFYKDNAFLLSEDGFPQLKQEFEEEIQRTAGNKNDPFSDIALVFYKSLNSKFFLDIVQFAAANGDIQVYFTFKYGDLGAAIKHETEHFEESLAEVSRTPSLKDATALILRDPIVKKFRSGEGITKFIMEKFFMASRGLDLLLYISKKTEGKLEVAEAARIMAEEKKLKEAVAQTKESLGKEFTEAEKKLLERFGIYLKLVLYMNAKANELDKSRYVDDAKRDTRQYLETFLDTAGGIKKEVEAVKIEFPDSEEALLKDLDSSFDDYLDELPHTSVYRRVGIIISAFDFDVYDPEKPLEKVYEDSNELIKKIEGIIKPYDASFSILPLIKLSWLANSRFGPQIAKHELGHQVERAILSKGNSMDFGILQRTINCLAQLHPERPQAIRSEKTPHYSEGFYSSEDFADLFAAKAGHNDAANVGCWGLLDISGEIDDGSLVNIDETDVHSSDFFRALHIDFTKKQRLTPSCAAYLEADYPEFEMQLCTP